MWPDTAGPPLATAGTTRLLQQLKAQRITVLHDTALQIDASTVHLGCGAQLACDVPLLALRHLPHAWLSASGLALTADGQTATDGYLRSSSHPQVWVANGDLDSPLRHLQAVARGARSTATARQPGAGFQLLFGGSQQAVMAWGRYSAKGRAWHWLKDWWARRQLRRYTM
jgi:NADH dehydrogenase FAD-containing subunit